jgi:TRAP-type C4-dicarboxylate transport system substrate-binding protein
MLKTLTKSLVVAAILAGAPLAAAAQEITLRATANSNENDEDYDGLIVFKDYVEAASNGAIAVELFIGTQLCSNGTECLQGTADGSIDVVIQTSGGTSGIFPYVQVLDLPYLMADDRVAEAALANGSPFITWMQNRVQEDSDGALRLMTIGNTGGWRNFANTERRISTPADMEGLQMRSIVADLPVQLLNSLGASATPIPWPELFTSLQTGVVQGTANGITDIMGMKFPEAGLQFLTLDRHSYMGALWFMNNERFMSLSPELRTVVIDGFAALQQATFASPKRKSIQAYGEFVEGGGEIYVPTPEEKAMFQSAAEPVYGWFEANISNGPDALAALRAAVSEAEANISAIRAGESQ